RAGAGPADGGHLSPPVDRLLDRRPHPRRPRRAGARRRARIRPDPRLRIPRQRTRAVALRKPTCVVDARAPVLAGARLPVLKVERVDLNALAPPAPEPAA